MGENIDIIASEIDKTSMKYYLGDDERSALCDRVESLKSDFSTGEIERIIYSELDDVGLRSEEYMLLLDDVLREISEGEVS